MAIPTLKSAIATTSEGLQADSPIYHLHIFPPSPHCYNISPFGIKLESYFRINKIDYDCIYTSKFGSKGMIPYIKVNNTDEICDSNVIVKYLQKHHDTTDASSTTAQQRAIAHASIRMLEEHTAQIGFHYRYGLNMPRFSEKLEIGKHLFQADKSEEGRKMTEMFVQLQPSATMGKSKSRGLTRHTNEELWQFSFDDLHALSALLGVQPYFFGKVPTLLDCTVFGHLCQFLYIPIDFPQTHFMKTECPNLVDFVERFRESYWPDWTKKCERQDNARYNESAKVV